MEGKLVPGLKATLVTEKVAAVQAPPRVVAGYELLEPNRGYPTARGRLERARFAALSRSWNVTAAAYQRSPLWERSHPLLRVE